VRNWKDSAKSRRCFAISLDSKGGPPPPESFRW
jgi:hypothetical protein